MKILNLLIVLSLSLIQFSCQNNSYNELAEDIEKAPLVEVEEVCLQDSTSFFRLQKFLADNDLKTKSLPELSFDMESTKEFHIKGTDINFYLVPENSYDISKSMNYSSCYIVQEKQIVGFLIKENFAENGIKEITYYDLNHNPIIQIIMNNEKKKIQTKSFSMQKRIVTRSESFSDKGDCVAKCIDSVYTDNGWMSVILFCATAYCPSIVAGVALWCLETCNEIMG